MRARARCMGHCRHRPPQPSVGAVAFEARPLKLTALAPRSLSTTSVPKPSSRPGGSLARNSRGPEAPPLASAKSSPPAACVQSATTEAAEEAAGQRGDGQWPSGLVLRSSQASISPPGSRAHNLPLLGSKCSALVPPRYALPGARGTSKPGRTTEPARGGEPGPPGRGTTATGSNSPSQPASTKHHSVAPPTSSPGSSRAVVLQWTTPPATLCQGVDSRSRFTASGPPRWCPIGQIHKPPSPTEARRQASELMPPTSEGGQSTEALGGSWALAICVSRTWPPAALPEYTAEGLPTQTSPGVDDGHHNP
mmetsp:Transcript_32482/g.107029  ORF Transcript_32482/g.107029 Transcript_32482/m.107029 type:complete len:308 (+) Transcript_32482:75-998(+)